MQRNPHICLSKITAQLCIYMNASEIILQGNSNLIVVLASRKRNEIGGRMGDFEGRILLFTLHIFLIP